MCEKVLFISKESPYAYYSHGLIAIIEFIIDMIQLLYTSVIVDFLRGNSKPTEKIIAPMTDSCSVMTERISTFNGCQWLLFSHAQFIPSWHRQDGY